jgi:hypothetical protein
MVVMMREDMPELISKLFVFEFDRRKRRLRRRRPEVGSSRNSIRTDYGVIEKTNSSRYRNMTYLQGECSFRRADSVVRNTMSVECLFSIYVAMTTLSSGSYPHGLWQWSPSHVAVTPL